MDQLRTRRFLDFREPKCEKNIKLGQVRLGYLGHVTKDNYFIINPKMRSKCPIHALWESLFARGFSQGTNFNTFVIFNKLFVTFDSIDLEKRFYMFWNEKDESSIICLVKFSV